MHAIFVRNLHSRQPGILLASDIEDAVLAERLVRSIAGSFTANGYDAVATSCWFRDDEGLHEIWCERLKGARRDHRQFKRTNGSHVGRRSSRMPDVVGLS